MLTRLCLWDELFILENSSSHCGRRGGDNGAENRVSRTDPYGEEKIHQLIQSQPKTESVLGVTLPILFGDFSFKLEILKLGDERIKTVWFKTKQKSRQYRGIQS